MLKKLYYKLPTLYQNYLNKAASKLANNAEEAFIYDDSGKNYNLSSKDKENIVKRIKNALGKIDSATSIDVHLELGKRILNLPKNDGSIVECGCYQGASTVSLSIFSKIVGKNLIIYDSFEGLPEPKGTPDLHEFVGKGSFKSTGITDISNLLKKSGCESARLKLVSGYFDESLTEDLKNDLGFPKASIVNIDVDYYSSTIDVLNWIEDLLYDGSLIYFDDINFYNRNPSKGQVKAINEFNGLRKNAGLAAMPGLDRFERVYVYWRNDDQSNENLKF